MKTFLLGGAAAVLAAGAAIAQTAPPPGVAQGTAPIPQAAPRIVHKRMMVMSNKVMTRDEVAAHVRRMFEHLDADHDGFLARDEIKTMHKNMMAMHGDEGTPPLAEHGMKPANRAAMFDRLDANKDGAITRQEFMAAQPQIRERRMIVMRGASAEKMGMHMRGMGMHLGGNMFAMADANKDGRVSLAEAQQLALAHFDRADANHDGKLTREERRQAHQLMRDQRHPS